MRPSTAPSAPSPLTSPLRAAFVSLLIVAAGRAHAAEDGGAPSREPGTPAAASVSTDQLYVVGQRPRRGGPVQASVADEDLARWNVGGSSDPDLPSNKPGFHPAPRVKVDTVVRGPAPERSSKKGVLSKTAVLAEARNLGYWPFRLCFEAGLRRNPKLRGKTRLRVTLRRAGKPASVRLLSTELADREAATCLVERARSLSFTPAPRRRVTVEVSIDLSHGDAPLPGMDEVTANRGATPDLRALSRALDTRLPALARCYADALKGDPKLWGRLGIRLDVDAMGTARTIAEAGSAFPQQATAACALDAIRTPPISGEVRGPLSVVWGVRFGHPPESVGPPGVDTPQKEANSRMPQPTRGIDGP